MQHSTMEFHCGTCILEFCYRSYSLFCNISDMWSAEKVVVNLFTNCQGYGVSLSPQFNSSRPGSKKLHVSNINMITLLYLPLNLMSNISFCMLLMCCQFHVYSDWRVSTHFLYYLHYGETFYSQMKKCICCLNTPTVNT